MDGRHPPADVDTDRSLLSRRAFLVTSALGTAVVSAGCFGDRGEGDEASVTADDSDEEREPSDGEAFAGPDSLEVLDAYHAGEEYDSDRAEVINTHPADRLDISEWSFETELASITVPKGSYLEPEQRAFVQFAEPDETGLKPDGGLLTVVNDEDDLVTEYEYAADPSAEPGSDDGDRTDADADTEREREADRVEDEPSDDETDADPGSGSEGSDDTGTEEDVAEGVDSASDADEGVDDSDRGSETDGEDDGPADDASEGPPRDDRDEEASTEDDEADEVPVEDEESIEGDGGGEAAETDGETGVESEERGGDENETGAEEDTGDDDSTDDDPAAGDGDGGGEDEGNETGTADLFGG